MSTEIIVNSAHEGTRVAVLEGGVVTELYIDRKTNRGVKGNIYKGKVIRVLPGIQAAFVDIGLDKAAFLYVVDVMDETVSRPKAVGNGSDAPADASADVADMDGLNEADSYEDRVEAMAEVEDNAPMEDPGVAAPALVPAQVPARTKRASRSIESLLKEGQEIIVQTSKEPIGTKGARVTTYVSLPGRHLVYMPNVNHVGVSKRILHDEERRRLKGMILRLRRPGDGYIVRTVSDGTMEDDFKQDVEFLSGLWQEILNIKDRQPAPALLHADLDLTFRTVRDLLTKDVDRFVIDSRSEYTRIKEFVEKYLPVFSSKIQVVDDQEPLFEKYGIEKEIAKACSRRVALKSGGYLVMDRAEALSVIDVNTGRYVGKRNIDETILKTNLEAARAIAHQLRLRNVGGIIVIDFIDMEKEKDRQEVVRALQDALSKDRAKTHVVKMSELGLVQLSRERTREDLFRTFSEPCWHCDGIGYVKSPTTVCHEIFREVRRMGSAIRNKRVFINTHPSVASLLAKEEQEGIKHLGQRYQARIIVKGDLNIHMAQYDIALL